MNMYIYENSLLTDDYVDWSQYYTSCRKRDSQRLPPEQGIMNLIVQLSNWLENPNFQAAVAICAWVQTRTKLFIHIFWLLKSYSIYQVQLLEWRYLWSSPDGQNELFFHYSLFSTPRYDKIYEVKSDRCEKVAAHDVWDGKEANIVKRCGSRTIPRACRVFDAVTRKRNSP